MTQSINIVALLILIAVIGIPFVSSLILLTLGIRRSKRGLAFGRVMIAAGAILLLLVLTPITYHLYFGGPWHSRVVAQGTSPSGQEYCVVQKFQSWVEPYRISLYVRDTEDLWRGNYLEHEGYAWRTAEVNISNDQASVFRNGKLYRNLTLPTDTIKNPSFTNGYSREYLPSEFSVDDVFAVYR